MKRFKKHLLLLTIAFFGCCFFVVSSAEAATEVYYSVGQSSSDLKTGSPTISINSGTATFSIAQTGNIGVGDKITYDTSSIVYISGKISTSQWSVVTATGGTPSDASDETVNSINRAYTSLNAAEDGAGDEDHLNTKDLTSGDGYILNIPCYYDSGPDTNAVNINGWTTGVDEYIKIYTPNNTSTEVNFSQRHDGKWSDDKYRLDISDESALVVPMAEGIIVDGLQIKLTSNSGTYLSGINIAGNTNSQNYISNNIIKGVFSGSAHTNIGIATTGNSKIWNNIVYDFVNGSNGMYGIYLGFFQSGTNYAYNNTVYNSHIGYLRSSGTVITKNNIAQDTTTGYSGTFDGNSTNNLSDQDDAPGSNPQNSKTVSFVDSDNDDFHLASDDSVAKDLGVDLSADSNLSFSLDIDGDTRSDDWDIGADDDDDLVAPVLSDGSPSGSSYNTDQTLSLSTDEIATCKYSTSSNVDYDSMTDIFSNTEATSHSQSLTNLSVGTHIYYVRCQDLAGNANDSNYKISFAINNTNGKKNLFVIGDSIEGTNGGWWPRGLENPTDEYIFTPYNLASLGYGGKAVATWSADGCVDGVGYDCIESQIDADFFITIGANDIFTLQNYANIDAVVSAYDTFFDRIKISHPDSNIFYASRYPFHPGVEGLDWRTGELNQGERSCSGGLDCIHVSNSNYQIFVEKMIEKTTEKGIVYLNIWQDIIDDYGYNDYVDFCNSYLQYGLDEWDTIHLSSTGGANYYDDYIRPALQDASSSSIISFSDDVDSGPAQSDSIVADWGEYNTVTKWDYDSDGICSKTASDYSNSDTNITTQDTETNNGKYICLYGEDSLGNIDTQVSAYIINIDISSETEDLEIDNVDYESTTTKITIEWETNNDADSKVKYGTRDGHLDQKKTDDKERENHEITLKDLTPDTTYFFRIYSEDEYGDEDKTKTYSIKTKKQPITRKYTYTSLQTTIPETIVPEPTKETSTIQKEIKQPEPKKQEQPKEQKETKQVEEKKQSFFARIINFFKRLFGK